MRILVIDGQGGNIGSRLVKRLTEELPEADITAVGTNSLATSAMLKAGATAAATGENAVVVGAGRADVIVGPIGIVIADALLGEVTPQIARAVGASPATRVLIPITRCDTLVAGVGEAPLTQLVEDAIGKIRGLEA